MARNIAVFGDIHGKQDLMVRAALRWQERSGVRVDLILCTGDFQAFRDETDMRAMACPEKYLKLGDYPDYHLDRKFFPAEIVFIGGNHEAYNWLDTMPEGGALHPNCYYLGRSGVIERLGLRIAGLTGNFSPRAFKVEPAIVDYNDPVVLASWKLKKKSTYFTKTDVRELSAAGPVDILLLHDWPEGLHKLVHPGTEDGTPRRGVGNLPARSLVEKLKPRWLFCGHMHQYYRGDIVWPSGEVTTFVCLDQVGRSEQPFMCVLDADAGECMTVASGEVEG